MKPDFYTKAVLTVIALLLAVIACNQFVNPRTTAEAQGGSAGLQFTTAGGAPTFFDPRTGEIWMYHSNGGSLYWKKRLNKAGQPLVVEYEDK